jgi:predicted MFS family arabinose efflux permease
LIAATYGLVRQAYGLFLPDVRAELSFSASTAGLISSAASSSYCVAATVGFFLASHRPRALIVAAALSAGLGAAGMAVARDTGSFAACAIVGSTGGGLASPGLVSIIGRNVDCVHNARNQAVVNAGVGPGLMGAGVLALVLVPDWRLACAIVATFTLVIAAAVLVLDRGHAAGTGRPDDTAPAVPPAAWFREHTQVIIAALLLGAGSSVIWTYGRTRLADAGASEEASIAAWIALGVGGAAVIGTARLISAVSARTAWCITTITVAVASATLGTIPDAIVVVVASCTAFGWGYTAATGTLVVWTTRIDATRAPAGTALLFVTLVFGQAIGAAIAGAEIASAGPVATFLTASVVTLAATAAPFLGTLLRWPKLRRAGVRSPG